MCLRTAARSELLRYRLTVSCQASEQSLGGGIGRALRRDKMTNTAPLGDLFVRRSSCLDVDVELAQLSSLLCNRSPEAFLLGLVLFANAEIS